MEDDPAAQWGGPSADLRDAPPPTNVGPLNPESKIDDEYVPDAASWWQVGFFVGYSLRYFNQLHAIFIHGLQNDQRRLLEAGQHSTLYSIPRPVGGGSRFVVGIPYWFETNNEATGVAPDGAHILQITSPGESITVFRAAEAQPNPVIRCTLRGVRGRHITCHPTETHGLVFTEDPEFGIFKDHHPVTTGGDFLLRIHGGTKNFWPSPYLESPGGLSATLSRGDASKVVTTDSPPADFVSNVCAARKVHLALGCENQARIPTISTSDILLAGGVEGLSSRTQVIGFIAGILKDKYFKEGYEASESDPDLDILRKRANKIILDSCIDKNHTTLLWGWRGPKLANGPAFMPAPPGG